MGTFLGTNPRVAIVVAVGAKSIAGTSKSIRRTDGARATGTHQVTASPPETMPVWASAVSSHLVYAALHFARQAGLGAPPTVTGFAAAKVRPIRPMRGIERCIADRVDDFADDIIGRVGRKM